MTSARFKAWLFAATASLATAAHAQTIVCVETNLTGFCMELLQKDAPLASANFLSYVDSGAYNNTLVHQSTRSSLAAGLWQVPPLVTNTDSAGTSTTKPSDKLDQIAVPANAAIANEYKSAVPNARGTVAMLITPGQPNSATSGFRINVSDNTSAFPTNTSSGAVFARILGDGMAVVDRLSKLTVHPLNSTFLAQAPLLQLDNKVTTDDLVQIKRIYRYAGTRENFDTYGINYPPVTAPEPVMRDVTCLDTSLGEICMKMFPEDAPKTVTNFMNYANRGSYDNSVFHRLVSGFVVQGGGFKYTSPTMTAIPADPPVVNEFKRSNTYGTVAMAKLGNDPNSATSQWFINLANNASNLDNQNGGFTVFAEVIPSSYEVLTKIAAIFPSNLTGELGDTFSETPLVASSQPRAATDFFTLKRVYQAQRDISAPVSTTTKGPLANVVAMGTYTYVVAGYGIRIPIRYAGKLYMMSLYNDSTDGSLYNIDLVRVVELIDNGRIAATFTGDTLTIPSVRVGEVVFTNVVMKLVDKTKLQFQIVSYDQI